MPDVDFSFGDILAQLSLNSDPGFIFNVLLYILFVLNLIGLSTQSDKNLPAQLLEALVLALIVIAKLAILDPKNIFMLLVNVVIFVVPFIVTGMSGKGGERSRPFTILAGVFGGVYFFAYWFILQRPA